MKKQPGQRNFNMPDADLYVDCMNRIRFAHRDIQFFEQYGYGLEKLKAFAAMCEQFRNLPDDHEMVGDQMIATEKKTDQAEKLRSAIRSVMTRVAMKFHDKTGRYRKFGTAKLGDLSDPHLLFCARRVMRVARQQIDFLADTGLNENLLRRVADAAADLEQAMHIQQDRWHDRDISVERRMDLGNKIYLELVQVADIGKDVWEGKDTAKYDQFCIYESNAEYKKDLKKRKIGVSVA